MQLPKEYQWLEDIGTLPKLVAAGLQYLGVKEIKGTANNPVIMDMAKGLGLEKEYTSDDEQSWCALYINHLIRLTGKPINLHPKDPYDLLRAKKVAQEFNDVPIEEWRLGDIVIINREGGGHVFLAIAKTPTGIIGLGGNQSNMVTFSEFSHSRIILAVKRYYATGIPASAKRYLMDSSGLLSSNEV